MLRPNFEQTHTGGSLGNQNPLSNMEETETQNTVDGHIVIITQKNTIDGCKRGFNIYCSAIFRFSNRTKQRRHLVGE